MYYITCTHFRFLEEGVWDTHCSTAFHCSGVWSVHVCAFDQGCSTGQVRSCVFVPLVNVLIDTIYATYTIHVRTYVYACVATEYYLYFPCSAVLSIGLFVGTMVVLVALIFKKNEAPTNFYLLLAFVSHKSLLVTIIKHDCTYVSIVYLRLFSRVSVLE